MGNNRFYPEVYASQARAHLYTSLYYFFFLVNGFLVHKQIFLLLLYFTMMKIFSSFLRCFPACKSRPQAACSSALPTRSARCFSSGSALQIAAVRQLAGAGFAFSVPRHVFGQAVMLLRERRRFCQGWRSHRAERGVPLTGSQA